MHLSGHGHSYNVKMNVMSHFPAGPFFYAAVLKRTPTTQGPSAYLQPIYHGTPTPAQNAVVMCCSGGPGLQHAVFGEAHVPCAG